ncbi:MAG: hypothetical protein V4709_09320 [Pseudomonadota bacterium]
MTSKSLTSNQSTSPAVTNAVEAEQVLLRRRLDAIVERYAKQSYEEMLAFDHLGEDGLEVKSRSAAADLPNSQ